MARARPIPELADATPLADAAARTVQVRAAEVFEFAGAALDTNDIEGVHDMRVATRRLRAALEVYRDCFPKPEFKRELRDVKSLASALGARRDPDVAIATVKEIAAHLPASAAPGVDAFLGELRADQEAGNTTLEAALAEAQSSGLQPRLLELAAHPLDSDATFGAFMADMV